MRKSWEVVVAQLVERSLPTPEVRGSNPVIGKIYMYWKDENKEKSGREMSNFLILCVIEPVIGDTEQSDDQCD